MQSSRPPHTGDGQKTGHSRHPVDDRPHRPDDDRRLLRVILAVPVVLLTLAAAFFLWPAINTRPDGDWDQAAYGGIESWPAPWPSLWQARWERCGWRPRCGG
ncbi:hypothetical protein [Streptomyces sp. NWU49]|uniref:hypothetical protein n=1 Tax=Streptomyces sp. NWU49 TaxID=2201153 RepID=UPI00215B445B|nr:hypothetical protein [Streptomyces sp. NWU49]